MHACRHCRFQTSSITTDNSLITTRYRSQWNSIWSQWPLITFYRIKFKDRLTDVISVWGVTFQTAFSTTGDGRGRQRGTEVLHSLQSNFFPPAWTTAWNSCVFIRWGGLIGFSVSNTLRRNTTGSSHNTHTPTHIKGLHRTELVTVLVNCDTSSSHPSRSRMGYHGSCWSIVYRVVTVSTMRQQKNWGCVCVWRGDLL